MNYFSEQMSDVIESDKKLTHEKIAEQLEAKLEDGAYWLKFKPSDGVRWPAISPSNTADASVHSQNWTKASRNGATAQSSSLAETTT